MSVLVLMTTFNGESFIEEQLQSILEQTVTPDRVIISDDNSLDRTCSIVRNFIKTNELNNWKLIENNKNIGWRKNFYQLIKNNQADFTFLCDQDDIWMNTKIEDMTSIMKNNSEIMLLTTDYVPKYESPKAEKIPNSILKTMLNDGEVRKININEKFFTVLRPGCTYGFTNDLVEKFKAYPFDNSSHDSILWNISLIADGLYHYSKPMIYFRRHDDNNSPKKLISKGDIINKLKHRLEVIENLKTIITKFETKVKDKKEKMILLNNQQKFYILRLKLLQDKKLYLWPVLFAKYRKYYPNYKRLVYDLFLSV